MYPVSLLRIGDLARLGGVSIRMLRHYHEIGLLVPAAVDEWTGYRSYSDEQLGVLRRIVELKELGLSLAEVESVLEQGMVRDLRVLLGSKRRDATEQAAAARGRIERIDAYLAGLDRKVASDEPTTSGIDVEIKAVAARVVAQLTAVAESWAPTDIGPVIRPLYPELSARLKAAGVGITGVSTTWYDDTTEGRAGVHATLTIGERVGLDSESFGFEVVELPALDQVATTIHRGRMDDCDATYEALLAWIEQHGYRPLGYSREIDIECGPDQPWVVELQIPVAPADEPRS